MSSKNDKNKIKAKEVKIDNVGDTSGLMASFSTVKNANNIDPTMNDEGNVVPSDQHADEEAAASEALNEGLHKAVDSASAESGSTSASPSSSSSDDDSVSQTSSSSAEPEASSSSASSQSSSAALSGSDAAEQIAGNDKDAAEGLKGNSPIDRAPFSINPANIQRKVGTRMEHIVDICEDRAKNNEHLSPQDIEKICSLSRSSIKDNENAFNILEAQVHLTLQKIRNSVKVVNYRQEKISDADPKANLQMLNEMAQRGIPQRFDEDVRILTRILRDDPFFQRYKQKHHLTTAIKPTPQFQAQANKVKQENAKIHNQKVANKTVNKSTSESRK